MARNALGIFWTNAARRISAAPAAACLLVAALAVTTAQAPKVTIQAATFWTPGICTPPGIPMAGDFDGSGRDAILCLNPSGDAFIDVVRTSAIGKPVSPARALSSFGSDALAAAAGKFDGSGQLGVIAMFHDGEVRLAHDIVNGTFTRNDFIADAPLWLRSAPPVHACSLQLADGKAQDVLIVNGSGDAALLVNTSAPGKLSFSLHRVRAQFNRITTLAPATTGATGAQNVIWQDAAGQLYSTELTVSRAGEVSAATHLLWKGSPGEHFATGCFRGGHRDDLIVGRSFLPDCDPSHASIMAALPSVKAAASDRAWLTGDFDATGRDALVRLTHTGAPLVGDDTLIQFASPAGAVNPDRDQDNDGLPDAWETGAIKPDGLDLKAMGCSPLHADVIVEVQPFANVDQKHLHEDLARAVAYYAKLPVKNPDGKPGINLHVIFRKPIPMTEAGKPWWTLADEYQRHRGITHYMVVYHGGGGQSDEMADRGSCGDSALWAVFLHEFGHQVGLDHTGFYPVDHCPLYPSLMNYPYSYQLNGNGNDIGYSNGALAGFVLNEKHLSEVLPFPIDKVRFLAGPPYHYHIKPGPDGKTTLIDWNWNGIFGEKNISADINYGYSTTAGDRHPVGKTMTAPALAASGSGARARLLVFSGVLDGKSPILSGPADLKKPNLAADNPGKLIVYAWPGKAGVADHAKFDPPVTVEAHDVIGSASAAGVHGRVWVAYPTLAGVKVRSVLAPDGHDPSFGPVVAIPDSTGAAPTLVAVNGQLLLLLWNGPTKEVTTRLLSPRGESLEPGAVQTLDLKCDDPPGAFQGANANGEPVVWFGLMQDQSATATARFQVRRYQMLPGGQLKLLAMEWVGGDKGGERGAARTVLLWHAAAGFKHGQPLLFSCGLLGKDPPISCHYVSMKIADKTVNGGWLTKRYYDEWTQSRSGPGACWFRGDIAFALRWFGGEDASNDNLLVAFHGTGVENANMGDYNDIAEIRNIGLVHSIPWVSK
ncbi:MAG: hypothetical protein KGJ62_13085 [Armatimonadetes bacterium]|nr:hypothetical protein [Armatimonadota bacterium]MDE2206140.1 hypothetical protein [Armatimonadota bacterium]